MNLDLIRDLFTCIANVQEKRLIKNQALLSQKGNVNIYSLFKIISTSSAPQLNEAHIKTFLQFFSTNLQAIHPDQIDRFSNSKKFPSEKQLDDAQTLEKGISLFLNKWGSDRRTLNFDGFSMFLTNKLDLPEKAKQVPYQAKRKLFEAIESQIQGLLNIQTLRSICIKQYTNVADLFQMLADNQSQQITQKSVQNLYLMNSQRMDSEFLNNIKNRLNLPLKFNKFLELFKRDSQMKNTKVKEKKIFYSSIKKKKAYDDFVDEPEFDANEKSSNRGSIGFKTPKTHKVQNHLASSTRQTKGEKIAQVKQSAMNVSKFSVFDAENQQQFQPKSIQILGQILRIQEEYWAMKRRLILKKDADLQLIYQRQGKQFETILNKLYGSCNFTSFVRFLVPQDYEHRYLGFVRYEASNKLSLQTTEDVISIAENFPRKQEQIQKLWDKIDREMVYRMYCNPSQKHMKAEQLRKYFSERECRILWDRMDPLRSGEISYQSFR